MPVPSQSQILSRPVDRPETAVAVMGRVKPAFRIRLDPRQVDCFDLRKAPKAALEKAGIEPGFYWLPRPYEMPASPGVNGVWCDVDAGWKTEDVLVKGYPALTDDERAAGVALLDAWEDVPGEFCPPKVAGGPLLRFVAVRGGRHYHSPFGGLNVVDPRQEAEEVHDLALQGCWIAWLISQGKVGPASRTQVASYINDARKRLDNLAMAPKDSPVVLAAQARLKDLEAAVVVSRGD